MCLSYLRILVVVICLEFQAQPVNVITLGFQHRFFSLEMISIMNLVVTLVQSLGCLWDHKHVGCLQPEPKYFMTGAHTCSEPGGHSSFLGNTMVQPGFTLMVAMIIGSLLVLVGVMALLKDLAYSSCCLSFLTCLPKSDS